MRIPTGTMVTVCVLSALLLAAGCAGSGVRQTRVGELVFLQAVGDRGPEPFTDSTATGSAATADPTRPASPRSTVPVSAAELAAPLRAARTLSGATPGLYRGTPHVAGCDVERHIGYLAADRAKADAFARAAGVTRSALPEYLRGLTPVVLGSDTRVTNHSYRNRRATGYQAVLQAGTAVLVDDRGVPRVRCACGNPLGPPTPTRGGAGARGTPWAGYRPNKVIVVAPAPRAVTSITIADSKSSAWIERRVGHDVRRDHVVPPPVRAGTSASPTAPVATRSPATGQPSPHDSRPAAAPARTGTPTSSPGRPPSPPGAPRSPSGTSPSPPGTRPSSPGTRPSPSGTRPSRPGTSPSSPGPTAPGRGRTDPPDDADGRGARNPVAPTEEPAGPAPTPDTSGASPDLSGPSSGPDDD
ncbi:hypothetical protein JK361_04205 [Streptomyces sp. 5-8]|uniref:DUF6777 domain-containing protein n=1 Tax=Streptomyces musisoli TaxID=2802280 RepID=A0ABS1NV87_9ACTN|nr:DUF6777 domain-containing protein [Streptomyces musisoli]MBL1103815.1 hypothetical protein [Streptomyces musisoli]